MHTDISLALGLSVEDIPPMPLDAPVDVIMQRRAVARELDERADARAAALRDAVTPGREFTTQEVSDVERTFETIRHERSVAAALRTFRLGDRADEDVSANSPAWDAAVARRDVRALRERPGDTGATGPLGTGAEAGAAPSRSRTLR
jgi:hypothetical protein